MMRQLLPPLLIFTTFTAIADSKLSIVNGRDAKPGEFPYMVSVRMSIFTLYFPICGGTILTPSWVLTAAQCHDLETSYRIVAGITKYNDKNPERQERDVKRFIIHPDYNISRATYHSVNDIALLQLKKPLIFNKFIQPIQLPKSGSSALGPATATGWGLTEGYIFTNTLHTVEIPILSNSVCEQINSDYSKAVHLCVSSNGKGVCWFDNGGPLVKDGQIVGIILSVKACATGMPDTFTKVSSFIDFIEKHIHPSN